MNKKVIVIPGPNLWSKDPVVITPKGIHSVGMSENYFSILRVKREKKGESKR